MEFNYAELIEILFDDKYVRRDKSTWMVSKDEETGQEFLLLVKNSKDIKNSIKKMEEKILMDQEEAELSVRQFGIIFSESEIVFLRIKPDILQINVQTLRKDLSKLSPAFLKKVRSLFENLGDFSLWENLYLRDDIIEEFYELYSMARDLLNKNIQGIPDDQEKEEFAENFMLQLLIVWYLQEKRFLNNNHQYLIENFREYSSLGYDSFYSFLKGLFELMMSAPNDGAFINHKKFGRIVITGSAPFLDGEFNSVKISDKVFYQDGLTDILKKVEPKKVENVPILNLFESRDWTEGNIDEFVLGAIYEKIISFKERKESGAYYTPESITSFICEDCISNYLVEKLNDELKGNFENLQQIFEKEDKDLLFTLFNELKNIKIVDPAVGSAHFLESAIEYLLKIYKLIKQKLLLLGVKTGLEIKALDETGKVETLNLLDINEEQKFNLYVKFFIILSRNIYGVDINPRALKVGRARLFLTLAKHFDVKKNYFIMFPNIHFNLRAGNSLIGYTKMTSEEFPNRQLGLDIFLDKLESEKLTQKLEFVADLSDYLVEIASTLNIKMNLRKEINKFNEILLKEEISLADFKRILRFKQVLINILIVSLNSKYASLINDFVKKLTKLFIRKLNVKFSKRYNFTIEHLKISKSFHWILEFPEVFLSRNGFDIVIGNPPYFRITNSPIEEQQIIGELDNFKGYHHGQGDIFYDFIVRSYDFLKDGGYFTFIVSRYWLEASYANYLKKFFKEKITLIKILDFRELKIFRGVDINNTIISYKKELTDEENKTFDVYIYERPEKQLIWKYNPLDMMIYCGKYNIDNWGINENWAFLVPKFKELFLKVKSVPSRIKEICECSQNNLLSKNYKDIFTFDFYPEGIPDDFVRRYRKMGEIKNYIVDEDIECYILIVHDTNNALRNRSFSNFLKENEKDPKNLIEVPINSNKNINKFNEVIFIGYRITRLNFNFIYNNNQTWVDNTYFFTEKKSLKGNFYSSFKYILGVLNSKLFKFYLDAMCKKKDNDLEVGSEILSDIPIKIDKDLLSNRELEIISQIETITNEIINLELKNEDITEKREIIDNLVFDLYELTDKEKELVQEYINETNKLLFGS